MVSDNVKFDLTFRANDYILIKENLKKYIFKDSNKMQFVDNNNLKATYIIAIQELTKIEYKPKITEISLC